MLYENPSLSRGTGHPEAKIAVMGSTGTGKSSFIKLITDDDDIKIGHQLESETADIKLSRYFEVANGGCVTFIDTPGFDDSRGAARGLSDSAILRNIAAYLEKEFKDNQMLSGIIYMHRIIDPRVGGTSKRNLRMFHKLCGSESMKNVVIITTMWDLVSTEDGERREEELRTKEGFLKELLDAGAQLVRYGRGCHGQKFPPPLEIINDLILYSDPVWLRLQTELAEGKGVAETEAGAQLDGDLQELIKKHREEISQVRAEMQEAIRMRDQEAKEELEAERKKLEQELRRWQEDRQELQNSLDSARATAEALKRLEWEEAERQRAAYERKMKKRRKAGKVVGGGLAALALTALL